MFKCIYLEKGEQGETLASVRELGLDDLPEGDVRVKVHYSSLNYKDGLAITGRSPVVRKWPMVPGIDLAGTVEHSTRSDFRIGDAVLLTGYGVGESYWGGLAQRASVRGEWLVPMPGGLDAWQSMAIGTAGYTAMLCLMALERHGIEPGDGEVLVTGAAGGVGSVAVALLAGIGYRICASTGRASEHAYLHALGAHRIIDRAELSGPGKPLAKEHWVGVIDTVGSHTLANACASTRAGGAVAACGLAQGMDFPATVAPFILRGISLYGIDSVTTPMGQRREAWVRLARDVKRSVLERVATTIGLDETIAAARALLDGKIRGRVVVDTGLS